MATLELINIIKKFGDFTAVEDFNLKVEDGEFVTLLGPSGCGKSTLLNMIAGLEDLTSGEIRINNKTVNQLDPYERDVAMVFQNYALYPHMTVGENIGFSLQLRKRPKNEIQEKVRNVASMLELEKFLHRLPRELSGGQQQRVAIARALANDPPIIIADEPTGNLDSQTANTIMALFQQLQHQGKTIVMVTHNRNLFHYFTQIYQIADGELTSWRKDEVR